MSIDEDVRNEVERYRKYNSVRARKKVEKNVVKREAGKEKESEGRKEHTDIFQPEGKQKK